MQTQLQLALLATALLIHTASFGQGVLTPTGTPAPVMKSLAQIEPRTPISSAPFTITNPGSYYLTTNLTSATNAIVILTNGVTLDLAGWTIFSSAPVASSGGTAILLSGGFSDITIANGHIRGGVTNNAGIYGGGGFNGIYFSGNQPVNVLVSRVSVRGCFNYGIFLGVGEATVAESCTARSVGGYGIVASTVKNSVATDCGLSAIGGNQVSDCRGESSGGGSGVSASTANNCYGSSSSSSGVSTTTANNCYGSSSGNGHGVSAITANNCFGTSSSGTGVFATTANNCRGSSSSGTGVSAVDTATSCSGTSTSGIGLSADTALNCLGSTSTSTGISASAAQNCYGSSSSTGTGLAATMASFCVGSRLSGTAISATVATGCYAIAGTNIITYKYNMP